MRNPTHTHTHTRVFVHFLHLISSHHHQIRPLMPPLNGIFPFPLRNPFQMVAFIHINMRIIYPLFSLFYLKNAKRGNVICQISGRWKWSLIGYNEISDFESILLTASCFRWMCTDTLEIDIFNKIYMLIFGNPFFIFPNFLWFFSSWLWDSFHLREKNFG